VRIVLKNSLSRIGAAMVCVCVRAMQMHYHMTSSACAACHVIMHLLPRCGVAKKQRLHTLASGDCAPRP